MAAQRAASALPASISWHAVYRRWRAASVAASMSASIAWTIWSSPIGLPNWRRCVA